MTPKPRLIDRERFAYWMGVLAEAKNRELSAPVLAEYRATLSAELTTDEFEVAMRLSFRDCTFFPSPQEIIEKVHPAFPLSLAGEQGWAAIMGLVARFPKQHLPAMELERFNQPTLYALRAVGGIGAVYDVDTRQVGFMHHRFLEAFADAAELTRGVDRADRLLAATEQRRRRASFQPVGKILSQLPPGARGDAPQEPSRAD